MYFICWFVLIGYSIICCWIEKLGFVGDVFLGIICCWGVYNYYIFCVNWVIVVVCVDKEWLRVFIMFINGKVIKIY